MTVALASIAASATEVRRKRPLGGIARADDKRLGGRERGTWMLVTMELEQTVRGLSVAGKPIAKIARLEGLTRKTVYRVLAGRAAG
jgi:hypothetical protein